MYSTAANGRKTQTTIGPPYLLELVADKENGGKDFVFAPGKHIYKNIFDSRSVVVGGQPKDQYDAAILRAKMMGAMARDEINIKVDLLLTTNLRSKKFSPDRLRSKTRPKFSLGR